MLKITKNDYNIMIRTALMDVIVKILHRIKEQTDLKNSFFINFNTQYPGVKIPEVQLQKYPENMTIVLQNQFWNLQINDTFFSVGISFDQIPCNITIPFNSILQFSDPYTQFMLSFERVEENNLQNKNQNIISFKKIQGKK